MNQTRFYNLIPASQSPTTPSSKRLQQHPLTFAVTPPPARTKTPTSLKAFPSVLNTDSSPKLLSPVVEQQNKIETTSAASPIDARTPVEDKQSITTNNEPLNLNHDILRLEKEPVTNVNQQNTEPIISQHDSVSNTINNSDIDTLNPPSQSSSLIENNLNIAHDALSDDNHRRLSNDISLSAQSPMTEISRNNINNSSSTTTLSRPISPSQPDELSKTENPNNVASPNRSRSPSPIINNNNNKDQKSPGLASSPTLENIEQLNNKEDNEKQHDDSKQSLNSSRRNSVINPTTTSRPLTPVSNELQQQEDKALSLSAENMTDLPSENELSHETLLSDVQKSESPVRSRPVSPTILETSELTSTNSLLSATEQTNNLNIPADVLHEDSLTNQSPRLLSISDMNTSEHEHQDRIPIPLSDTNNNQNHLHSPAEISEENHTSLKSLGSEKPSSSPTNGQRRDSAFTEGNQQKSPIHETAPLLSSIPQNSEYTKDIGSPTFESNDIKRDFDENTTSLPITDTKYERSRSPSPTILQEQNRSVSPVIEQKQERSRSPSPSILQEQEQNRSVSPVTEHTQQRSRSPSPTIVQVQEQNQFVPPLTEQKQQRSRSPSSSTLHDREQNRAVSPVTEPKQQRSRSPSPTIVQEQNRSVSPLTDQKQQRSRSPSPSILHDQEQNRAASPVTEQKQQRSRSPSLINEQNEERSRSSSPIPNLNQEINRSSSLIAQQEQQRSQSPSPTVEQKHEQDENASLTIKHNLEQNQQRSRSPSFDNGPSQLNNRSLSPVDHNLQGNQSTSVPVEQEQERNRSPSPVLEEKRERSRSPSPNAEKKQEQNPSSPTALEENYEKNRTPSPVIEQRQERSRSPSPSTHQNQQRSQSPSVSIEQQQERNRSSSPSTEQKEKQGLPLTSPSFDEQKEQTNRSPSPTTRQEQQRSRSPSPVTQQKEQRSRSPSPSIEQNQQKSRSSSLIHENQRKDSSSMESFGYKLDSKENEDSIPRTSDNHETETQLANKGLSSPIIDHQEQQQLNMPASPSTENERRFSSSQLDDNILSSTSPKASASPLAISPKLEENNNPQLSTHFNHETTHNPNEIVDSSPIIEQKQLDRTRSPTPTDRHETSVLENKIENQSSRLALPSATSLTQNHSTQPGKSPVNENIPSTQRSSIDHHHDNNPSPVPIPPVDRQVSITRSQSQSTIARPNTLRFSPNNHDLDGLYMTNDYNDEDEITTEDNEYHHNSAPSTVSVEYRRSSLLHDNNNEQKHTPIDPHDISKRLSIVEKSRTEGILYTLNNGDIFTVLEILFLSPFPYYFFGIIEAFILILEIFHIFIYFFLFLDNDNNVIDPTNSKDT